MWYPETTSVEIANSKGDRFATVNVFTGSSKIQWGSVALEDYWLYIEVRDTSGSSVSMPSEDFDSWSVSWTFPQLDEHG